MIAQTYIVLLKLGVQSTVLKSLVFTVPLFLGSDFTRNILNKLEYIVQGEFFPTQKQILLSLSIYS